MVLEEAELEAVRVTGDTSELRAALPAELTDEDAVIDGLVTCGSYEQPCSSYARQPESEIN